MTEFDKLNLMVVPIQDPVKFHKLPNYKGYPVKWSDPKTYCSWEEREEIYPDVSEWYVVPASRQSYPQDGVDIAYYVIDVDNHEGDKFKQACEFLRSCNLPKSLTVRTPSGGIHKYYKCLAEYIPRAMNGVTINGVKLPIEIKSSVGVVAPNGRDRIIIDDSPVAMLMPEDGTLFSQIVCLKEKKSYCSKRETDPDFDIEAEEFPEAEAGDRHNTLMAKATSLYVRGCPPDKIQWWGEEFYRRTNRKEQRNEISNIVRDAMAFIDDQESDIDELMDGVEETPSVTSPNRLECPSNIEDDTTTDLSLEAILGPLEELTGWDSVYAKSVFSDKEETKKYMRDELKNVPPADIPFVRSMLDPKNMRDVWAKAPYETKVKYEMFKDTIKLLLT